MKVLLTGGSGFVGGHILKVLLGRGHSVVLAVRRESQGREIIQAYNSNSKITFNVVSDITSPDAFRAALLANADVEGVIHAASPFHFHAKDVEKDLLQPAIQGTVGILKAVKDYAPSVKKVVITSSMAAVVNPFNQPDEYTEGSWNPITREQALSDPVKGYLGSKTLAERAGWEFAKNELPGVGLATINPPIVLGPVIQHISSLEQINTSNQAIADIVQGKWKDGAPPTPMNAWVDVRDVALAHVIALEKPEANGRRFLMHGGFLTHKNYVDIVWKNFPDLRARLPEKVDDEPIRDAKVDTKLTKEVLGIEFVGLEESVTDTVKSMLRFV